MKITITVYADDETVKINIPLSIAEAAVNAGLKLDAISSDKALTVVNLEEVVHLIKDGVAGELMSIETDDGTKIVISAE